MNIGDDRVEHSSASQKTVAYSLHYTFRRSLCPARCSDLGRRKISPPFGGFTPVRGGEFSRAYSLFSGAVFEVGYPP